MSVAASPPCPMAANACSARDPSSHQAESPSHPAPHTAPTPASKKGNGCRDRKTPTRSSVPSRQILRRESSLAAAPSVRDLPSHLRDVPVACRRDESRSPSATAAGPPARETQNSNKRRPRPLPARKLSSPSRSNPACPTASLRQILAGAANPLHFLLLRRSRPSRAAARCRHPRAVNHPQILDRPPQATTVA